MTGTNQHPVSFEFFPPKTEVGMNKLQETRRVLGQMNPEYFSVTYGAGGSTRDNTKKVVFDGIDAGFNTAPHLSFGGDEKEAILNLLKEYQANGVSRIVALRGDLPSGFGAGSRLVHANELVSFIREHTGDHFQLAVAAYPEIHPEAESYDTDIHFLKQKFDAGANSAITQYFFNPDAYAFFIERCQKAGIDQPIYPGIMPITNFDNLKRFSQSCGAEIPRWLTYRVESLKDSPDDLKSFCTDFMTSLCEKLLSYGAPGLHFYTMNQIEPTQSICHNLNIK
ncbi:MAG: methylenetetrahydrofolate reductase [NAD(P)H] [Cellvibrionales bacterium]|jgi:methylenetetrahydrofolate reductase (NADPH)|nr:methylenetetrahydrofolate reductase [NAD(P)H] [Cellvibrionales bacterium]MBT6579103.1 methylenetetrahydrofolate reductase [NAD(P)H] [Cellvibrionales bacterium]